MPAPATTDAGKFLKADGTWDEVEGGITELTTADYNYPTASPNGVLPIKLADGVYKLPAGLLWWDIGSITTAPNSITAAGDVYFLVTHTASNNVQVTVLDPSRSFAGDARGWSGIKILAGNPVANIYSDSYNVLPSSFVVDNLNSTSTNRLLSANQGKVLNDTLNSRIIGSLTFAPTTSTAGAVGALVATVESGTGHLYICTDDTGGSYNWQQLV